MKQHSKNHENQKAIDGSNTVHGSFSRGWVYY